MTFEDNFDFEGIKVLEEQTAKVRESSWVDEKIDSVKGSGNGILNDACCFRYYTNLRNRRNGFEDFVIEE